MITFAPMVSEDGDRPAMTGIDREGSFFLHPTEKIRNSKTREKIRDGGREKAFTAGFYVLKISIYLLWYNSCHFSIRVKGVVKSVYYSVLVIKMFKCIRI